MLTTRPLSLWLLLAREATHEIEVVVPGVEHHDTLHLLTLEAAEEVEMDRAASHPRVSTMLLFPPVLQEEVIEETEEDMDRTGIAMFLHLSKPNSNNTYLAEVQGRHGPFGSRGDIDLLV